MDRGASSDPSASPIRRPKCTARSFATGRLPGSPRHTAPVRVLGGSPKDSSQPQNIFVAVASCTWISRAMTAPRSPVRPPPAAAAEPPPEALSATGAGSVEADRPLERGGGVQQPVLAERGAGHLEAHRET